jgi:hypothetical protein
MNSTHHTQCCPAQAGGGKGRIRCPMAPLCQRIRVSVGTSDAQTIEIGWGSKRGRGLVVVIHVHEAGEPTAAVHLPLGLLLRLWDGTQADSSDWLGRESGRLRTSSLEVLGDGSLFLKVTMPDACVHVPAALVESFKFAVGLLLRLSDKTVGKMANLSDAGGTYSTTSPCHLCGTESTCRTNAVGITLCRGVDDDSVAITQNGCFVHLEGLAAERTRTADQDGGWPCASI